MLPLARSQHDVPQVRAYLEVNGDAVRPCLLELLELPLGREHHQVAVEHPTGVMHERGDRLEHDRAHRDRRDEVAVADVEVEDAGLGAQQRVDLLAEP